MVKLDVPYFDRNLHIKDYLDWEHSIESCFEYTDIPLKK